MLLTVQMNIFAVNTFNCTQVFKSAAKYQTIDQRSHPLFESQTRDVQLSLFNKAK